MNRHQVNSFNTIITLTKAYYPFNPPTLPKSLIMDVLILKMAKIPRTSMINYVDYQNVKKRVEITAGSLLFPYPMKNTFITLSLKRKMKVMIYVS